MNSIKSDSRIYAYIETLPAWQQEICRKVRKLVHLADSEIVETIKRTNRPYFILNGNVCALLGTKDHVNIFIYDPIAPDPENIVNQGQNNLTAGAILIFKTDRLHEEAFLQLIKSVIANNRAGGWRRLQRIRMKNSKSTSQAL